MASIDIETDTEVTTEYQVVEPPETILASLLIPRNSGPLNEPLRYLMVHPTDENFHQQHRERAVGRVGTGSVVTAMAHINGRLAVGYADGYVQLFKSRKLELVEEMQLAYRPIDKIIAETLVFYFLAGNIARITSHKTIGVVTQMECRERITGFLRGRVEDYLVDEHGYIYMIGRQYFEAPGSTTTLTAFANFCGINSYVEQVQQYSDRSATKPRERILAIVTYRSRGGIVFFNEFNVNDSRVLRTGFFCTENFQKIEVKAYNDSLYFLNVIKGNEESERTLFVQPLKRLYSNNQMELIINPYAIKFFEIQNDRLIVVNMNLSMTIYDTSSLDKTQIINVGTEITTIRMINNTIILGQQNGDITSLRLRVGPEMCLSCRQVIDDQDPVKTRCYHSFPKRRNLPARM